MWFAEDGPGAEGWSLVVTLTEPVAWGDKSSTAIANLAFPQAPHQYLKPGRVLELVEANTVFARVRLGEPAGFIQAEQTG